MARFYVYALVDPTTDFPFYIGKGSQLRTMQHFADRPVMAIVGARTEDIEAEDRESESLLDEVGPDGLTRKQRKIKELKGKGKGHGDIARIVMQDMDESVAFDVESFLITSCYSTYPEDRDCLLNIQAGHHPDRFRRYDKGQQVNWPLLDRFDLFDPSGTRVRDDNQSYYVYALVDPETSVPFYIGKGKAGRLFQHFDDARKRISTSVADPEKLVRLRELLAVAPEYKIGRILARGLSEDAAFAIEALLIRFFYGFAMLTNQVDGQKGFRVRPKPNGAWPALPGFDQPRMVDPNSSQDREWLREQLMADGIHLPIEKVCKQLTTLQFDDVRVLDAGGLAREGDVTGDGRILTRLKVFVRRRRMQVEARPRSVLQRAWMRDRFDQAGYPSALRRDGVFIPTIWRGARNMTSDVQEAVRRAQVIYEILTRPLGANFHTQYGRYLQVAEVEKPMDAIDAPRWGPESTPLPIQVQAAKPQPDPSNAPVSAAAKMKNARDVVADATDCVRNLEQIPNHFEDLEFLGPYPVKPGLRIFVKALCPLGDGNIWLVIYCGKQGFQCELRGVSNEQKQKLDEHMQVLGVRAVRDEAVFKFLQCEVTKDIRDILDRISMLLQFASAGSREELVGIPPQYFQFWDDAGEA